jgi:uncharacterized coiled-coil DUF342 family protein
LNYDQILKHILQQVQEQPEQSPELQNRLNDLKTRWSDVHNKVVDQQQTIEDVVPAAITCEEAWEEVEPHLNDVEARLKKITTIPVEHKGLTKQQNILKVSLSREIFVFTFPQFFFSNNLELV